MFRHLISAVCLLVSLTCPAAAQDATIQDLLQEHRDIILDSSRRTIGPAIDALGNSDLPAAQTVLEKWQNKEMWYRESDDGFYYAEEVDRDTLRLFDFATNEDLGEAPEDDLEQLKPNSGIRGLIGAALVQFQLKSDDKTTRIAALDGIARDAEESHLAALRSAIEQETDADVAARMARLERLLTIEFGATDEERVEAIESFKGDLGVDVRAALNPILVTRREAADALPDDANIANELRPGTDALTQDEAYTLLVEESLAEPRISTADRDAALVANIQDRKVAGIPVGRLNNDTERDAAYAALADLSLVPPTVTEEDFNAALDNHVFFDRYLQPSSALTDAAQDTLRSIELKVALNRFADLTLDAMSLASIYFLAAIGLAVTFGVMGVINMAHGEFIMMGAYTGYVVQQIIPDYTVSIVVALPLAFCVTFAAGVAMERLVIRWLYNSPLETLLATFGISIALQQIAKNIFGTQARPLTSPGWLDGALVFNDVVSISYIRIAIFALAIIFAVLVMFIMNRTRLGLEVRAVTQNPAMASSMGINPDRINMLTFGLGSGIAGIAGVAIGLFSKVTSELGQDYIVQSFMTVVIGGVGNIWGTIAGATLIGFLQKGIEWMNPSNSLAAQTYMIIFIIIFIQFRPRGIIALKGRAAGA
ncbi:urea ABC transporter permease subunit UrtB [Qingshengfaniella alkalisoli]|uniref:Urea ABC transporter permease subunit UrtB n=1 Tax=Qingshengfaniella alkalisoli TaxID=2599296 RepID=A0A5B8IVZ9_9RHOB|nr:urea ABC transporter permease subunit UrtB [Qingshengfaniella alkalisoli]QDY69051.1 urea ABC transporter permease subunit UrtB [Qingshengfaniella alkalisoli]